MFPNYCALIYIMQMARYDTFSGDIDDFSNPDRFAYEVRILFKHFDNTFA